MKTIKYFGIALIGLIFLTVACKKEYSFETGYGGGPATGTFLKSAGQCFKANIHGQYVKDSLLNDSNYVLVDVLFATAGKYNISTETQNGFSFADSGFVVEKGLQTIKLKATGKPDTSKTTYFLVTYGTDFCSFAINVTDTFVRTAQYNIASTGGKCSIDTVQGTFKVGQALNPSANFVTLKVNVTTPGVYSISTTKDGMTFSAAGSFNSTLNQTVTLRGTGTPTKAGYDTIPVTAGGTTCSFAIKVDSAAVINVVDYFPTTDSSNWTYDVTSSGFSDTARISVAGIDKSFAGNTYRLFLAAPDGDSLFYRKGGGSYYEYGDMNPGLFDTVNGKVEFIFMKDNVPAGSMWSSPQLTAIYSLGGVPITGTLQINFTMGVKDTTLNVGTQNFINVIRIRREYVFTPTTPFPPPVTIPADFFYAKGIGFIKAVSTSPVFPFDIDVKRYFVK